VSQRGAVQAAPSAPIFLPFFANKEPCAARRRRPDICRRSGGAGVAIEEKQ